MSSLMHYSLRTAVPADVPALEALIARSARGLSTHDYRPAQVEGALRGAFGVDSQLVEDRTYYVVEKLSVIVEHGEVEKQGVVEREDRIVGCGGWSFRATLFGGDARGGRDSSRLDPRTHAAKIRAFFVDPSHARRGIGSMLLEHCENEARVHGFTAVELMGTLPGVKLYGARGYVGSELVKYDVGSGEFIEFVPMRKALA